MSTTDKIIPSKTVEIANKVGDGFFAGDLVACQMDAGVQSSQIR